MIIGIPKEILPHEKRVAASPETVAQMREMGFEIIVETGAGQGAFYADEHYVAAGAKMEQNARHLLNASDIVFKVNRLSSKTTADRNEIDDIHEQAILIGNLQAMRFPETMAALNSKKITAFALDCLPRVARSQSMDILSSMSNIAGYKSVIIAAEYLPKFFPMLTTAAGSIPPAKVVVIGAGVAGLQAIATARRLGAMVIAFDPRPVVEEQVKSLGANFVPMVAGHGTTEDAGGYAREMSASYYQQEQEIIRPFARDADVIITTALIPGKPAPLLLTEEIVSEMKPGSVIIDLAIEQGGNCVLTEADKVIVRHAVSIIGNTNMPSTLAAHASHLYSRNLLAFLKHAFPNGAGSDPDLNDEILQGCLVTYNGITVHPGVNRLLEKRS